MSRRVEERYEADSEPEPRHGELLPACVSAVRRNAIECWGFDGLPRRIGLDYPENGDDTVGRTLEDIGELVRERWFSDCTHASESGCAVKRAIDVGELNPSVWSVITRSRRNRSALLVLGLRPEKESAL